MDHSAKQNRLKKIEGQIRGIQKMIEEKRYCVDILHAIGAASGALKKVETAILKDHLTSCVKHAFVSKDKKDQEVKLKEILDLIGKLRA